MTRNGTLDISRKSPGETLYCTVVSCSKPHLAKGLCSTHYQRQKNTGRTDLEKIPIKWCSETSCDKRSFARGLCESHYAVSRAWEPRVCKFCQKTQPEVQFQGYRKQCNSCAYRRYTEKHRSRNLEKTMASLPTTMLSCWSSKAVAVLSAKQTTPEGVQETSFM